MILDRLLDLEKTPTARPYSAGEYNLEGFRNWVETFGTPHKDLRFVHIAGTKGKGSTAALTESLLLGLGFDTALYSSPHLAHRGERYRFNGVPWTVQQFEAALERLYQNLRPEDRKLLEEPHSYRTVFELLTLLALTEFAEFQRSSRSGRPLVVVWETGLGGRLDCTNIIDPLVCVLTAMGFDHMHLLGNTIESITLEKAGIIKPARPVVLARQTEEHRDIVLRLVAQRAAELSAPVVRAWEFSPVIEAKSRADGEWVRMRLPDGSTEEVTIPLRGAFQRANLEAATSAAWLVQHACGVSRTGAFLRGATSADWPGRLEMHALPRGRKLLMDGAHCPLSARMLACALCEWKEHGDAPWDPPFEILWAMQKDKQHEEFLRALSEHLPSGFLKRIHTYPLSTPRTGDPQQLARIAVAQGIQATPHSTVEAALRNAMQSDTSVLAVGSLYGIAEIRELHLRIGEGL